jgi:pimeloyl-ACP methyl ester carboxylesterase
MSFDVTRDPKTGTITGFAGYEDKGITVHDFGGTAGIKDLVGEFDLLNSHEQKRLNDIFQYRYFYDMCEALYRAGYKERQTLFGMPYDFRLVLDPRYRLMMFHDFKYWIEHAVMANGGSPAVVVAHSLGAVIMKWFLIGMSASWRAANVHRVVTIGAPVGGAINAVKAVLYGDHYVPLFHRQFRDELRTVSGIVMCLPNKYGFVDPDEVLVEAESGSPITRRSYGELAEGGNVAFEIWRDLYEPHLEGLMTTQIDVCTDIIMTTSMSTHYQYKTKNRTDYPYDAAVTYGDGIVPYQSLLAARQMFGSASRLHVINGSSHTNLISDPRVLNIVLQCRPDKHVNA